MTALRTLLSGLSDNSFKLVTLTTEKTAMANALPRTKANFDSNTLTWLTDAAVAGNPMGGVGGISINNWNFSAAAISELDGKCTFIGVGHTDGGDGSIYTFDTPSACANINGAGSGIAWALAQPSCMYIDAFVFGRPTSGTSPEGAQQEAPTTPGGANQAYWVMNNKNGVAMPMSTHAYHFNKYIPGTRNVILSSGSGFDANSGCNTNSAFVFADDTGSMTGPLISASIGANCTISYGYAQADGASPTNVCVNPRDGTVYASFFVAGTKYGLTQWTNPTNSSIAIADTGAGDIGADPGPFCDAVIFKDPSNSVQDIWFVHNPNNIGDTHFSVFTGISNGTPVGHRQTYTGSAPTTSGGQPSFGYAWDSSRSVIWMCDGGGSLYKIAPVGGSSNLTNWTISAAITGTGDAPPAVSNGYPQIQYIASEDCLIHVQETGVRVYRPTGYSPPAGAAVSRRFDSNTARAGTRQMVA